MPVDYITVLTDAVAETDVKRSRFIAQVRRVESEAAARQLVETARAEHWDARHHCSAFVLGPRAEITRSNDDGEPSGTAGTPILQAITGRQLSDVSVVVTRYFGGTLLGAGGLSRAYGDAAAQALEAAGVVRRVAAVEGSVAVEPAVAGKLENLLRTRGFVVTDVEYAADVRLALRVPHDEKSALEAAIAEVTQGNAELVVTGEAWIETGC